MFSARQSEFSWVMPDRQVGDLRFIPYKRLNENTAEMTVAFELGLAEPGPCFCKASGVAPVAVEYPMFESGKSR